MNNIIAEFRDGMLLATINGNIDGQTAPDLQSALMPHIATTSIALFDVTAVPYMSSAGFRLLLLMYRNVALRGGRLAIIGLSDEIRETMEMTGFLDFFLLAASLDEAIAQVQHVAVNHA
jgi:anti-sigma B factor antagonist